MHYLNTFIKRVIKDRGLPDDFFRPSIKNLNNVGLLGQYKLDRFIEIMIRNLAQGNKIVVYGDIDIDGIFSTYIFEKWLTTYSDNFESIFNKQEQKHGVVIQNVPQCDLLILLDSSSNEQSKLRKLIDFSGITKNDIVYLTDFSFSPYDKYMPKIEKLCKEIIVIDHHEDINIVDDNKILLINPYCKESNYPNKKISNGLLTWKLLDWLENTVEFQHGKISNGLQEDNSIKDLLDVAVITLISDGMDLSNMENRYYYYRGTCFFKNKALSEMMRFKEGNTENVIFGITTLLNAFIKIDRIDDIYKLLMSEDIKEIKAILKEMSKFYKDKKEYIKELIDTQCKLLYENDELMIVRINRHLSEYGKDVASKLSNYYFKNVLLVYRTKGSQTLYYGSGRGYDESLKDKINNFGDYVNCVGHQTAFGLYCHDVNKLCKDMSVIDLKGYKVHFDFELDVDKISMNLMAFTKVVNYLVDNRSFKPIRYKIKNIPVNEIGASKSSGNKFILGAGFRLEQWNDYWTKGINIKKKLDVIGNPTKKQYADSIFVDKILKIVEQVNMEEDEEDVFG